MMKIGRALEIIWALSGGVDPYTGEMFAEDSPYQRAETVRALFVAVNANLVNPEAPGERAVNMRDFALLADEWLMREFWP